MRGALIPLLALGLFLTACSFNVTVDLPDQSFDLSAVPTGEYILYQEVRFEPSPLNGTVRAVRITGQARLQTPASLGMSLYGRSQSPQGCSTLQVQGQTYYLCPKGSDDQFLGQLSFSLTNPSSPLDLQGQALAEGIRQGRLWLGVQLQGSATGNTLYLTNLKALVTLGL